MSTGDLISFAVLCATVAIIAIVGRRFQAVGLPPGAQESEKRDGGDAVQEKEPEGDGTLSQQAGGTGRRRKSKL